MNHFFLTILAAMILAACSNIINTESPDSNQQLDTLFQKFHEANLKLYPLGATAIGDERYNNYLPNNLIKAYRDTLVSFYQSYQANLLEIDSTALDDLRKLNYKILSWELAIRLEGLLFSDTLSMILEGPSVLYNVFPIDQFWTLNLVMGQWAGGKAAQPFKTANDYYNWLARVDDYLLWCDSAMANMRQGIEVGYILPKSIILKVIPQLESFASGPVEDHIFYLPVKNLPDSISEEEREDITMQYTIVIEQQVISKYQELVHFFQTEYWQHARETSGICHLPDGDRLYQYLIKYYTTTNLTANQVYDLGVSEVERITAEMLKVKEQVGFEGELPAFFEHVRTNPDLMPYTDPSEVIDHYNAIHEKMKPQLTSMFELVPTTGFEVRRTEAFREASASAGYSTGSMDGKRPGIFYVPIPNASEYNVFPSECLFLHEAIPGHHYQISLQQENTALPMFQRLSWYNAYGEGWALYCESLGEELGLYTNPYQYFGMLSYEIHRAIRLVVDVGIHAKGWTREEAIAYSMAHEAMPESAIVSEIERYMAGPAQALSYKIGQLKILELRKTAEQRLGDKFNIKDFHRVILESGCLPLSILEEKIEEWITEVSV